MSCTWHNWSLEWLYSACFLGSQLLGFRDGPRGIVRKVYSEITVEAMVRHMYLHILHGSASAVQCMADDS